MLPEQEMALDGDEEEEDEEEGSSDSSSEAEVQPLSITFYMYACRHAGHKQRIFSSCMQACCARAPSGAAATLVMHAC